MVGWLVGGVAAVVVAVAAWIWYNARKAAVSESESVAEKALRVEADKRSDALEARNRANDDAAREKDSIEGSEIVQSRDGKRALDFLQRKLDGRP